MGIGTENLRRGAFGQLSVPSFLSRRAHLLTTSSSQSPRYSVSTKGENCDRSLAPPLPTEFPTLRGPLLAVVLPAITSHATVRSARRMRLLMEPYGQCHTTAVLLSLSTQTATCFAFPSKLLFPKRKQLAACQ